MIQSLFLLQMAPDKVLEVTAPNVAHAIHVAAQALPHVGVTENERAQAMPVSDAISYTLTCLCCHVINPQHAEQTLLVAMQEHLMVCHGLTQAELAHATRVFWGTHQEGCFLWWTPARGAYLRAWRYAITAPRFDSRPPRFFTVNDLTTQVLLDQKVLLSDGHSATGQQVKLIGMDEHAWYSVLSTEEHTRRLLIWPKQVWAIVPDVHLEQTSHR